MRYIFVLALIAQLAVQSSLSLPIISPLSSLATQDESIESGEVLLHRRDFGASGFFRPWNSKTISSSTEVKLKPDRVDPVKPAPSSQTAPPTQQANAKPVEATPAQPQPASPPRYTQLRVQEKNQMMANAYKHRAKQEVLSGARASRRIMGSTGSLMGKHSRLAMNHFRKGNIRQGFYHTGVATRTGLIGTTAAAMPLVNGLRYGSRASGTAMKYRAKQWTGSKWAHVPGDSNVFRQKANMVRGTTPGYNQSKSFLGKTWGDISPRPRPGQAQASGQGQVPSPPQLTMGNPANVPLSRSQSSSTQSNTDSIPPTSNGAGL